MKKVSEFFKELEEEKKDKYDEGEYDQEGDMAKSDLRSIIANAQKLHDMIDDADNLPEWVQSKITVAEDYISTVANYMTAEMSEAAKLTPQQKFKNSMKRAGYDMDAGAKRLQDLLAKQKKEREEREKKNMAEGDSGAKYKVKSIGKDSKGDYYISPSSDKKVYKSGVNKGDHENPKTGEIKKIVAEDTELQEANAAAIAAATAIAKKKSGNYDSEGMRKTPYKNPDAPNRKTNTERKREMDESYLEEKNVPTNPSLWSRAKALARQKFDVYPCVPLDSLAISKKGPIAYDELEVGEEILTYNMKHDLLEWKPVLQKHYYENAPLVEIGKPTGFAVRCTPNHKWVVSRTNEMELVETKDLNTHMKIIMCSVLKNDSNLLIENWSKKDNWIEKVLSMNEKEREIFLASSIVYDGWDKGSSTKIKDRHTFGFVQKEYDHLWASLLAAYLNGYYVNSRERNEEMTSATYIRNKKHHNTQNLYKKDVGFEDVWCPTTENETWVMVQNGLITITGNSAYANGWASKWYKSKGGSWKSVSESKEDLPFEPDPPKKNKKPDHGPMSRVRHLAKQAMKKQTEKMKPMKETIEESRKAEIVKEIVKKKKNEMNGKFEADPVLTSSVVKENK